MTNQDPDTPTIHCEFLFLDLSHCTRCRDAKAALAAAIATVQPALHAMNIAVGGHQIHVTSAEQARALSFVASPTIRINGRDIQLEAHQSACKECGELCNCSEGVDCRQWEWNGARTLSPPVGMIVEKLMVAATDGVTSQPADRTDTVRPRGEANMDKFFGSATPAAACCSSRCCG